MGKASNTQRLAISITKAASLQTYYTVRLLADRELIYDAYRAYAYFRWVDDWLDQAGRDKSDRIAFVNRQERLIQNCYQGNWGPVATAEEQMVVDIIQKDQEKNSGLQSYVRNMLAVMAFDAGRRDRLISQGELNAYVRNLGIAVTEALHYFIGHHWPTPHDEARYLAAMGAHMSHMLRDAWEDNEAGYFNVPREFLEAHNISPLDVQSGPYKAWVKSRVQLARTYFTAGRAYLAQVENVRCRLAGYSYMARFEGILDAIEREGYLLRPAYPERKTVSAAGHMAWSILRSALDGRKLVTGSRALSVR